jgi:hypothetical protein
MINVLVIVVLVISFYLVFWKPIEKVINKYSLRPRHISMRLRGFLFCCGVIAIYGVLILYLELG